eukprot:g38397.t1
MLLLQDVGDQGDFQFPWCEKCIWLHLLTDHDQDVSERLPDILKGEAEQPAIIVHIGTNDIGRHLDVVLRNEYRELGRFASVTRESLNEFVRGVGTLNKTEAIKKSGENTLAIESKFTIQDS